jgi:DNA repair protein RadC
MTDTLDLVVRAADVPQDRPRERLLSAGAAALETPDLLAVLLGTGAPGQPAESLARDVLEQAGGLRPLAVHTPFELASIRGLGDARAARLLAAFELGRRLVAEPLARGALLRGGADVFRHYHAALRDLRVEQLRAGLLDGKHRVIREELISQGTLTSSPVHPREVFAPAVRHSAAAVVLVHNHPSGDPQPSADDLDITRRLADAGRLLGVRVVDHVIVGDGSFVSLADRGAVPP